jgi:aspartate/tyrosine/aromatic aminotransferase
MCAQDVRQVLHDELAKLNGDKDWSFILRQLGMFSFTGLNPGQVRILMAQVHLYEVYSSMNN